MDMDMRYMRMVMSICDTHIALYIVVMGTLRNPRFRVGLWCPTFFLGQLNLPSWNVMRNA